MTIATIILAAGSSSRLGEPKQLLTNNGKTLVRQITETALSLKTGPVVVVLGANQAPIQAELKDLPIQLVHNPNWQEGMASSLQTGLNYLSSTSIDAFLVLLTDQPFVTPLPCYRNSSIPARKRIGALWLANTEKTTFWVYQPCSMLDIGQRS